MWRGDNVNVEGESSEESEEGTKLIGKTMTQPSRGRLTIQEIPAFTVEDNFKEI